MSESSRLLATRDVREYFQHRVAESVERQQVPVSDDTVVYVVDLLTRFTRTDRFYEWSPEGMQLTPLALTLGEALRARSAEERRIALQRLGDVALFVAGVFTDSLERKAVDVDYYIAMGENAYSILGDSLESSVRGRVFSVIFGELADCFPRVVDVLAEIRDQSALNSDADILRAYEVYLRTGSRRVARKLRDVGIQVSDDDFSATRH